MIAPPPLERGACTPSLTAQALPQRLQRSRRRGARTPEGAVYVGRPSLFGNPFDFRRFGHARSVKIFERWIERDLSDVALARLGFCPAEIDALRRKRSALLANIGRLTGQPLQCWCPVTSRWCHADTLLALANPA